MNCESDDDDVFIKDNIFSNKGKVWSINNYHPPPSPTKKVVSI